MIFFDQYKNKMETDSVSITSELIRSHRFEVEPITVFGSGKKKKLRIKEVTIRTRKNPTYHFHHRIGGGFSLDEYNLRKLVEKKFIRHNGLFIKMLLNK